MSIKVVKEVVSDSKYRDPVRVRFKVVSTNDKIKIDDEALKYINSRIKSTKLFPEILIDGSDGSYQVVFPGESDWIKALRSNIKSISRSFDLEVDN